MRSRAERRSFRRKFIERRLGILENIWKAKDTWYSTQPGRLNKYNLDCTCKTCRLNKEKYNRHKYNRLHRLDIEGY